MTDYKQRKILHLSTIGQKDNPEVTSSKPEGQGEL